MLVLGIILCVISVAIIVFAPMLIGGHSNWISADQGLAIGMAYSFAFIFATFGAIIIAFEIFT